MSSLYTSTPLKKERKEIRLVTLHPGKFGEDIQCDITVASLLENPQYEALSYVWGDATRTAPILVNGHEKQATANLVTALRYLRENTHEPRILWIDAISIDQASNEEKSWQVAMMSSIYASCTMVNIWLGPELDSNDRRYAGWFSLTKMYPGLDVMMQMTLSLIYELSQDNHLEGNPLLDFREGEFDPCDDDPSLALQGINVLLHRPWWERVWVIQEAVIPSKAIVTAGYLQLDWKVFTNAAINFGKHIRSCCREVHNRIKGYDKAYLENFYNAIDPIAVLQLKRNMENPLPEHVPDFMEIFYAFSDRKATLIQDKIFSLFGLLSETDTVIQNVPVDYSVNEVELCKQITIALLKTGSLEVLVGDQSVKSLENLPSWSKDFTITLSNQEKFKARNRYTHQRLFPFFAPLEDGSDTNATGPIFLEDDILQVKGIHVDTIKRVVGKAYPENLILDTRYIWPWLIILEDSVDDPADDYANPSPIKVNPGQNLKEAFWRTMLGEHTSGMSRPNPTSDSSAIAEEVTAITEELATTTLNDQDSPMPNKEVESPGFNTIKRLNREDLYEMVEWLPTMWENPKHANLSGLEEAMMGTVQGRSFMIGEKGRFGLVPKEAQVGDEIWVLQGGRLPFVLREVNRKDGSKRLVGEGFIHGILDGEITGEEGATWEDVLLC